MQPDIDLSRIRPYKTSRNKGFEEISVQLFRDSQKGAKTFYRVDDKGGDGGVEDFAVFDGGKKIGMQAKFPEKLGQSQWTQINKSVRTAISGHSPDLTEYHIYCPFNRSKKTATWDNYVRKWNIYAQECGYEHELQFVWMGETEIVLALSEERSRGAVAYWFGCETFSLDWLKTKFEISERLLDSRYTPESNVRTESEQKMGAFLQTDDFIRHFLKLNRALAETLRESRGIFISKITPKLRAELELREAEFFRIVGVEFDLNSSNVLEAVSDLRTAIMQCRKQLLSLREEEDASAKKAKDREKSYSYQDRAYSYELHKVSRISKELDSFSEFLQRFELYRGSKLLVFGEAGSGKSHLIAHSFEIALNVDQPVILLLGEVFKDGDILTEKIVKFLGWEHGFEAFLSCLDMQARLAGKPAVIAIDAVNESRGRDLWKQQLFVLQQRLENYPNIRLIVSCRTDFMSLVLPSQIVESSASEWAEVEHFGFNVELFDAVLTYFESYGVRWDHFPQILEEFRNPLFLKTFCETFQGEKLPAGIIGLDRVLSRRLKLCQETILERIDCPEYVTKKAVELLAEKICELQGAAYPLDSYRPLIDEMFGGGGESRSLYRHLRANGIVVETVGYEEGSDEPQICVRFAYERFSDFFICSRILDEFGDLKALRSGWSEKGLPEKWVEDYSDFCENRGLLRMFAVLVPERFGIEFIQLFEEKMIYSELLEDFLASFVWRAGFQLDEVHNDLLAASFERLGFDRYYRERMKVFLVPDHPLNVLRLHHGLMGLSLQDLERCWTLPICNMTADEGSNPVDNFLKCVFKLPGKSWSDEQVWLASIFLAWLLGSNFRLLRLRASLALIKLLRERPKFVTLILKEFANCSDPYIVERIYGVACGVALRGIDSETLGAIALTVYFEMFEPDSTPPNVVQRDFAQAIIFCAESRECLPSQIDVNRCKPPFRSKWPKIMPELEVEKLEKDKQRGWSRICTSLVPEEAGMCLYGDFGRYVMDAELSHFSRRTLRQPAVKSYRDDRSFSGLIGRRFILQRIKQLGWKPELFQKAESLMSSGRLRVDQEDAKVERIGKKYQWIGLREFTGLVADRYRMKKDWGDIEQTYEGAWQLYARGFDPTQPLEDPVHHYDDYRGEEDPTSISEANVEDWTGYPDPFAGGYGKDERKLWVESSPFDQSGVIQPTIVNGLAGNWLNLSCHLTWKEELDVWQDEAKEGTLKMWTDIRCWLLPKENLESFLDKTSDAKFYGNGCDLPELHKGWIGEFPWAPSIVECREYEREGWLSEIEQSVELAAYSAYDSRSEVSARIPSPRLCEVMGLTWGGEDYQYIDIEGDLAAISPTTSHFKARHSLPLLVRAEAFLSGLEKTKLSPVWAVLSERSCYSYREHKSIVKIWGVTQRLYGLEHGRVKMLQEHRYEIPLYR